MNTVTFGNSENERNFLSKADPFPRHNQVREDSNAFSSNWTGLTNSFANFPDDTDSRKLNKGYDPRIEIFPSHQESKISNQSIENNKNDIGKNQIGFSLDGSFCQQRPNIEGLTSGQSLPHVSQENSISNPQKLDIPSFENRVMNQAIIPEPRKALFNSKLNPMPAPDFMPLDQNSTFPQNQNIDYSRTGTSPFQDNGFNQMQNTQGMNYESRKPISHNSGQMDSVTPTTVLPIIKPQMGNTMTLQKASTIPSQNTSSEQFNNAGQANFNKIFYVKKASREQSIESVNFLDMKGFETQIQNLSPEIKNIFTRNQLSKYEKCCRINFKNVNNWNCIFDFCYFCIFEQYLSTINWGVNY